MSYTADENRGRAALVYFNNEALKYPDNYSYNLDSLVAEMQRQSSGQFLDGFGFAISSSGADDTQVRHAMEWLADQGQGSLPQHWNAFFNALSDQTTNPSFLAAVGATVTTSAVDLAHGAQNIGDALIKTGSIITTIGPFVIVGAILFIVAMRSKQLAGS